MYLSILFCNVYNNLHCSVVIIFCLYRTASPDSDNITVNLHIKFVYDVISLHQSQEKCSSKIWQSNVVVFRPLHKIEA